MKCVVYFYCVTPHQVPFVNELMRLMGPGNCKFVYRDKLQAVRARLGWDSSLSERYTCLSDNLDVVNELLRTCKVLITEVRDVSLFECRARGSLYTYYTSERWFKSPWGIMRLLHPKFLVMALRVARLLKNSPGFYYLPIGIYAAQDMARLCGLYACSVKCLFRCPAVSYEHHAGGKVCGGDKNCSLDKLRIWTYFVAKGQRSTVINPKVKTSSIKVLWVGRMLKLKRVDTIIKAVIELSADVRNHIEFVLDIYGNGEAEASYRRIIAGHNAQIRIFPSVPLDTVRSLMRSHDIYVLSSDSREGWGAVVNEALEEGMCVFGTVDSGAGATLLPIENQFHAGDIQALKKLLSGPLRAGSINGWSAYEGARWMFREINGRNFDEE